VALAHGWPLLTTKNFEFGMSFGGGKKLIGAQKSRNGSAIGVNFPTHLVRGE